MNEFLQIQRQTWIEEKYNAKHTDCKISTFINSDPDILVKCIEGTKLVLEYLNKPYHESKTKRLAVLKDRDILPLVIDIIVGTAYFRTEELFTSASSQIANRLGFDNKLDEIKTAAELLAVLCETDLFDITKSSKQSSLYLVSKLQLPKAVIEHMDRVKYLPPMVCEPLPLIYKSGKPRNNFQSGYLTHNDALVLGKDNNHDGDLCIDVINIVNSVALTLDTEFLSTVEKEPTFELDTREKVKLWETFKEQCYKDYLLMVENGNRLYFNNKVDKRGRMYPQGYYINPMGTSFDKACLELANKEYLT